MDLWRQYRNRRDDETLQSIRVFPNCELCGLEKEDITHFMLSCPVLAEHRTKMIHSLERDLLKNEYDLVWHHFMCQTLRTKMKWLIGDYTFDMSEKVGEIFDTHSKTFLMGAYLEREQCIESRNVVC